MLKNIKMMVLILSLLSFAVISCDDTIEEDLKKKVEEENEQDVETRDSSVVELPCHLISYDYEEDGRYLAFDLEVEGSKIVKSISENTYEDDVYRSETVFNYDGYNLTSIDLNNYLNGELIEESEDEETYFIVNSDNGILKSLLYVEKYFYEDVYFTYVTKEEYTYSGSKLVKVTSLDGDDSATDAYPDENGIELITYIEEYYTYNEVGNMIKEETIYSNNNSARKNKKDGSMTYPFREKTASNKVNQNSSNEYNFQHDDKLNPFSGFNVSSLAILNWGYLFDGAQLLSTNNIISANSTEIGSGENPFTQEINITFDNTYDNNQLLEGSIRNYSSVYTSGEYQDTMESMYTYGFGYSCD